MAENRRPDDRGTRPGWDEEEEEEEEFFNPGYSVRPDPIIVQGGYREVIQEIPSFESLGPRITLSRDVAGPPVQRVGQELPPRIAPPHRDPAPLPVVPQESTSTPSGIEGRVRPIPEPNRYYAYLGPNASRRQMSGRRVYLSGDHQSPPSSPPPPLVTDSSTQTVEVTRQQAHTQVQVAAEIEGRPSLSQAVEVENRPPLPQAAAAVENRPQPPEASSTEKVHSE